MASPEKLSKKDQKLHARLLAEPTWHEAQQDGMGDPTSPRYQGGIMRMHPRDYYLGILTITADAFERNLGERPMKAKITGWKSVKEGLLIEGVEDNGRWVRIILRVVRFHAKNISHSPEEERRDVDAILWREQREEAPLQYNENGDSWREEDHDEWFFVAKSDLDVVPQGSQF